MALPLLEMMRHYAQISQYHRRAVKACSLATNSQPFNLCLRPSHSLQREKLGLDKGRSN